MSFTLRTMTLNPFLHHLILSTKEKSSNKSSYMEEVAPVWVKRGVQGSEKHPESCFLTANLRDSEFQASGRWVTMGTDDSILLFPSPKLPPLQSLENCAALDSICTSACGCLNLTSTNHEISHTRLFDMVCSHMCLVAATEHCRHSTNPSLPESPTREHRSGEKRDEAYSYLSCPRFMGSSEIKK